jgi:hypothetical protein
MDEKITWRFLVVDDRQADEVKEFVEESLVLDPPNEIIVESCKKFNDAIDILNRIRIDLVILDIKDQADIHGDDDALLAGQAVFEKIRNSRFVPVIFHTAYPHKANAPQNPYVKIVDRSKPRDLIEAIKDIFETNLPKFSRFLESEQRMYMWGQVLESWKEFEQSYDKIDLTYLLARRLAHTLQNDSIRRFLTAEARLQQKKIHPVEMYVYPPASQNYYAGDLFKNISFGNGGNFDFGVMLTPSCDLEHGNAQQILIAECKLLRQQPEYIEAEKYWAELKKAKEGKTGTQPKETAAKLLKQLLRDNHSEQKERYKFLPGTFFLPDLLIDFQSLQQISAKDLVNVERVASIDSPFAESVLAKFSRYYGRLGTPDLDTDFVYNRLAAFWESDIGEIST